MESVYIGSVEIASAKIGAKAKDMQRVKMTNNGYQMDLVDYLASLDENGDGAGNEAGRLP